MTLNRTGLNRIKAQIEQEKSLIEQGLARLRETSIRDDIDDTPPEILIKLAKAPGADTLCGTRQFLQWAAVHHKHLAIHHYPEGEDRIGFRYPPR